MKILNKKQEVLSQLELDTIIGGLEFTETNTENGIVEDFYQTTRGFDDMIFYIQEIPVEVGGEDDDTYEYQEFKMGFGTHSFDIVNVKILTSLNSIDKDKLCKIIKYNLSLTDSLLGLKHFQK